MNPRLDDDLIPAPAKPAAEKPDLPALPDLSPRRRRGLHPVIASALGFMAAGGIFYGMQAFGPEGLRPSRFVGEYETEVQKARKAGELEAQIRYDAQLRGIEVQYQGQLNEIQTAAVQLQERCRAGLQNFTNLYQAAYNRANTGFQMTAELQRQYVAARMQTAQGTLAGETSAANMATTFGYIAGFFDPELGRRSMEYAEAARQQALRRLDETARNGVTLSIEGWDTGLPDPATLQAPDACETPEFAAALQRRVITVPQVEAPLAPARENRAPEG